MIYCSPHSCRLLQVITAIVNVDGGVTRHGSSITSTIGMSDATTLQFQVGLVQFRLIEGGLAGSHCCTSSIFYDIVSVSVCKVITTCILIYIIAITSTIQRTYHYRVLLNITSNSLYGRGRSILHTGAGTDKGLPTVVNRIDTSRFLEVFQFRRNGCSHI